MNFVADIPRGGEWSRSETSPFWVRYFMSTAVSIPPIITLRAHSIAPAIGGDRTDLRPPGVPALITRRWRAFPAQRPLFHCRSLARPVMLAPPGKPKRRKRARALHKAHSSPANLPASSFNPASMRSATERTQYCTPDLTEASGSHHHASLCIAAYGFLILERSAFPPSARWRREKPALSGRSRSSRTPNSSRTPRGQLDRDDAQAIDDRPSSLSD